MAAVPSSRFQVPCKTRRGRMGKMQGRREEETGDVYGHTSRISDD